MTNYLDETGNLTGSNGKYFIVGSYTTSDPKKVEKAFRKWQKNKFPRKLKDQAEVKFKDSSLTDELRLETIQYLLKQDIKIFYTYLQRKNIPEEYHKKGKVYETGLLYAEIVRATLELYLPIREQKFIVIRDQRTLKRMGPQQFHEMLKASLLPKLPSKTLFLSLAIDSTSSPQVQVADWICGALGRYYEKKPLGDTFYAALKGNIVERRELFSDYWAKKWQ